MREINLRGMLSTTSGHLGWVIFFSFFLNISYLAAPLYMMQVYDRVLRSQSVPTLLYLTLIVCFAYGVFAILDAVRAQVLASVSDVIEEALASRLMSNVVAAHEHEIERPGSTQIGRDLDTVRQFAAGAAVLAFVDLPWAPIYLSVLYVLDVTLGMFATAVCVVLLGLSLLGERVAGGRMARANMLAIRSQAFGDAIVRSACCLSTMGLGTGVTARWKAMRAEMLAEQTRATERTIILTATAKFIRLFTQSAILGVGAYLAIHHRISSGSIFAGSLLLGRCLAPVEAVIANWRSTISAYLAFQRIRAISQVNLTAAVELPTPLGELSLDQIGWIPSGADQPALSDVSMRVDAGAVLAVIGPNAAGKSTLGRILSGALRASAGTIRLDGTELHTWSPAQLSRAIGYLPQDSILLPGTIRDNIARFLEVSDADVVSAAQAALAHDMITRLPLGYQTQVQDMATGLSGGQRQRIALARALLFDPPVLVLDEPSASLDADGEAALIQCIAHARERRHTVVLITHSSALVRLADHVATVVNGRVVRVQRSAELLLRPLAAVAGA